MFHSVCGACGHENNMNTKTAILITTIVLLLGGAALARDPGNSRPLGAGEVVPPIGFILDEPTVQPGNIRARLELLTGGGAYPDREIRVVVTKRTAQENKDVLKEFNTVIVKESTTTGKAGLENDIKANLPDGDFINATK